MFIFYNSFIGLDFIAAFRVIFLNVAIYSATTKHMRLK